MKGNYGLRPTSRRTLVSLVLILAGLVVLVVNVPASSVSAARSQGSRASSRAADTAPPVAVAYHFQAQFVQGKAAGTTLAGQVSGLLAGSGVLTATLTATTGVTATVTGVFTGTTALAPMSLAVRGKAGTMTLKGRPIGKPVAQWGGTIAQGGTPSAGSWLLTPETQALSIDIGGKSSGGSKHKVTLAGALALMVAADGRADGTFTLLTNGKVLIAEGHLLDGNLAATIHMPGQGDVLIAGSSKPFLQVNKWSGGFVGPAAGDAGTWTGQD